MRGMTSRGSSVATSQPRETHEAGKRRLVLSEDLPLTLLTAVTTALVMNMLGLAKELVYVGVVVAPFVADVVKNSFAGLRKRWLVLLTALLVLFGTAGRALAARVRSRPSGRVAFSAMVATAALSAALAVGLLGAVAAARGALNNGGSVQDTVPPRLHVPRIVERDASGPVSVHYRVTAVDGTDGRVGATCAPASGHVFAVGTTTVRCSAVDDSGNRVSKEFMVIVTSLTAPVVVVPSSAVIVEADGPTGAPAGYPASAHAAGGKPLTVHCAPPPGAVFPLGSTHVTCSAVDASGRRATGQFSVLVRDHEAPMLTLPSGLRRTAPGAGGAAIAFSVNATDRVDGAVQPVCRPASGSRFAIGTTTVTCTALDAHGNRAKGSFTVMVSHGTAAVDTVAPTLVLPPTVQLEATGAGGARATYTVLANDDRDGSLVPRCVPSSGATFPVGTTVVRCVATDSAGNQAQRSFAVTVVDTTAPTFAPPASVTAEATSPQGASVAFTASARDLVDGTVAPVCAPATGSTFPIGVSHVSCQATDRHGNIAKRDFAVTVADTTGPTIALPGDLTVEATSAKGAPVRYAVSAVDKVSGTVPVRCSAAPGQFPLGRTTVSCTSADARGNTTTKTFAVTVVDTTPPVLRLPSNFTLRAAFNSRARTWGATVTYTAAATDRVDGAVIPSCSLPSGTYVSVTATTTKTVQCTATDSHGNRSTAPFDVTIVLDVPG